MKIQIELGENSYPVHIGANMIHRAGELAREHMRGSKVLVVSNETVGPLYRSAVVDSFAAAGYAVDYADIPDGEQHKNEHTLALLYDACVDAGLDRGSALVAVGGGVVGDLVGYVAATYMRGIDFIQIPTSLLSQVDASVGGKTGINHAAGKNLIGAFHQPKLVLIDVATLHTLPRREFIAGMAEVVKHGLIADAPLFAYCESAAEAVLDFQREALMHIVARSVEIKASVVETDEREAGVRAILNFGHTVGHAIEAATAYHRYTHGEAVSIGMIVEGRICVEKGRLTAGELERITALLTGLGLPVTPDDVSFAPVWHAMEKDKKNRDGRIQMALLNGIGRADVVSDIRPDAIRRAYAAIQKGSIPDAGFGDSRS